MGSVEDNSDTIVYFYGETFPDDVENVSDDDEFTPLFDSDLDGINEMNDTLDADNRIESPCGPFCASSGINRSPISTKTDTRTGPSLNDILNRINIFEHECKTNLLEYGVNISIMTGDEVDIEDSRLQEREFDKISTYHIPVVREMVILMFILFYSNHLI
ncbi:hypothetical protein DICVIV_12489 [Dictyocaulus viviparus]|uniref:Uncharacterized protein n=1 Tax=Dictyocaulus viviparus TaxID=29172 RepID=A0A0D8XAD9_DICVI|nr:hypothetical protein DICVIV_12489 [Dictyocaulus viviparus]